MNKEELSFNKKDEYTKTKIEHMPALDIISNLDYENAEERDAILNILREEIAKAEVLPDILKRIRELQRILNQEGLPAEDKDRFNIELNARISEVSHIISNVVSKIESLKDGQDQSMFFVKSKSPQEQIDFLLGRTAEDPIEEQHKHDFNNESRRALAGVTSELKLSKKIKNLVAQESFQNLAHKYDFSKISFCEPIAAVIDKGSGLRYLVYPRIKRRLKVTLVEREGIENLPLELRKLFLGNGIEPHDLRLDQLMQDISTDPPSLVLIDVEAYTESKKV